MRHPLELRRPLLKPCLMGMAAAVIAAAVSALLTQGTILVAWHNDRVVPLSMLNVLGGIWTFVISESHVIPFSLIHIEAYFGAIINALKQSLADADLLGRIVYETNLCSISTASAGIAAFAVAWLSEPKCNRARHISGRRHIKGTQAQRFFRRSERRVIKATGAGLELAPGLRMSRQRETRHILVVGSSGGGKTVFIRFLLKQILKRGDRVLVHDSKGDMAEGFPTSDFILLAPHDQRSAIWDIGKDIRTAQDAREFAAEFIPESRDPIWATGAREIFAGVIIALQATSGDSWGWSELKAHAMMDIRKIRLLLQKYYPEAASYLEVDYLGTPTKIALSFFVTLCASLAGTILPLALAWPSDGNAPKFSIRSWLPDERSHQRHVIFQRAAHLPELSSAWIRAFIQSFSNSAVGPLLPDDSERRIFLVLDEFAQLKKMKGFQQILEAGRSKGLCVTVGLQDPHQLADIYGADASKTWQSSFGTKVIFKMTASASASLICHELIGKQRVAWTIKNKSSAPSRLDGTGGGMTRARQTETQEIDVITPDYLEKSLGWTDAWPTPLIRGLVLGIGSDDASGVVELVWPIAEWPSIRPAIVAADWLQKL